MIEFTFTELVLTVWAGWQLPLLPREAPSAHGAGCVHALCREPRSPRGHAQALGTST